MSLLRSHASRSRISSFFSTSNLPSQRLAEGGSPDPKRDGWRAIARRTASNLQDTKSACAPSCVYLPSAIRRGLAFPFLKPPRPPQSPRSYYTPCVSTRPPCDDKDTDPVADHGSRQHSL